MSVNPPLAELTALVIDGASGPGRIVSSRLSAAGASVAIVTVSDGGSAAYLSKELTGLGLTALPYQVDLADRASLEQLLADVTQDLGQLHLLVNLLPETAVAGAGEAETAQLRMALLDVLATACRGGRLILLAGDTPSALGALAQVRVDTVEMPQPLPRGWVDPAVPASAHHATANAVLLLLGIPAALPDSF
ncbi:SDR family NAD(P)-dependent oxidoreductase [Kitasatospora sp. NPDC002227]|uniref:SDR family NAD(P)-dependent oxidoreductase n=1 Tax=Kitasatospora sp. NPDC002227 TaxID=3154773 RepID=UPI0033237030